MEVVIEECHVALEMLFQMFHQNFSLGFISILNSSAVKAYTQTYN